MNERIPAPLEVYRHFKGKLYQVLAVAKDAGTMEETVVYQGLYPPYQIWTRPLKEFTEKLDPARYPDAGTGHRFERVMPGDEQGTEPVRSAEEPVRPGAWMPDGTGGAPDAQSAEDSGIDPQVEAFLDARTVDEKLAVLGAMRHRVTNEMIDTMAIASGVEIEPGDVNARLADLRECLATIARYEHRRGNRL